MKIATIDIGTNSMRLLIAEYIDGKLKNRKKYINTTRIGQGVDKNGYISEESILKNLDALVSFREICDQQNCKYIYCMGTSALRDSKNSAEFIKKAKCLTGINIDIISGEYESQLGFMGVREGINENDNILVIDIGGGSTEFILGDKDGIRFSNSIEVGALRMTEKFIMHDPISTDEVNDLYAYIDKEISYTVGQIKKKGIKKIVGIGGTITSLSAINQQLEFYSMDKIHNSKVSYTEIELILQNLIKMTINDKINLKGLQSKRADIITAGVVILDIIMKKLEIYEIYVSEYDNLEGLMCQKAKSMS